MHFEFLVEDRSGKVLLDTILPRLIESQHTFRVIPYKGIGHLPKDLRNKSDPNKRILLDQLPRLLSGYGKAYSGYSAVVFVICDLDQRDETHFLNELQQVTITLAPCPTTFFCLAIEEGEAWLLGDLSAIQKGYPKAKTAILKSYVNDSICGTWELLADALYLGGSQALGKLGYQAVGQEKTTWAQNIAPLMNIAENLSPSFQNLRQKIHDASHS